MSVEIVESRTSQRLDNGDLLRLFVVKSQDGLQFTVCNVGASLVAIEVPDINGKVADVLVGPKDGAAIAAAASHPSRPCFGATIGRVANRISGSRFAIGGAAFPLDANEGPNCLHGGPRGFDRMPWKARRLSNGVQFHLVSDDGDQGFPGELSVRADFRITGLGEMTISYEARTTAATHVNLALHPYFNLSGLAGTGIEDHIMTIDAETFVAIDDRMIPLGLATVAGTPFDVRRGRRIGTLLADKHPQLSVGAGLDHCYVLTQRPGGAATLVDPGSGRRLRLSTSQPGLQVYSANALGNGLVDRRGTPYQPRQAIALEAQGLPDAANRPEFPSTLLRPGSVYRAWAMFRFDAPQPLDLAALTKDFDH